MSKAFTIWLPTERDDFRIFRNEKRQAFYQKTEHPLGDNKSQLNRFHS